MTIMDLESLAEAHGYALIPQDTYDELLDVAAEHEELRCDLDLLSATLVDDAITAGLGTR